MILRVMPPKSPNQIQPLRSKNDSVIPWYLGSKFSKCVTYKTYLHYKTVTVLYSMGRILGGRLDYVISVLGYPIYDLTFRICTS